MSTKNAFMFQQMVLGQLDIHMQKNNNCWQECGEIELSTLLVEM